MKEKNWNNLKKLSLLVILCLVALGVGQYLKTQKENSDAVAYANEITAVIVPINGVNLFTISFPCHSHVVALPSITTTYCQGMDNKLNATYDYGADIEISTPSYLLTNYCSQSQSLILDAHIEVINGTEFCIWGYNATTVYQAASTRHGNNWISIKVSYAGASSSRPDLTPMNNRLHDALNTFKFL